MSTITADMPASTADLPAAAAAERGIAVRLDAVTRRFADVTALSTASLDIRRGELMTLLGPSGCGKTTLLNLIAGFVAPDEGVVTIDGRRVNEVPTFRREI